MATIQISNLSTTGAELFGDSESYLNDLTNEEMNLTGGFVSSVYCKFGVALAKLASRAYQAGRQQRKEDNACYVR